MFYFIKAFEQPLTGKKESSYLRSKKVSLITIKSFNSDYNLFSILLQIIEDKYNSACLFDIYSKGPSIKYVWNLGKCAHLRRRGGDITTHVYVRTYTISIHVFGSMLFSSCPVFFVKISHYLRLSKDVFVRNGFPTRKGLSP